VRSHAGAKHNEAVDKLARDAALTALDGRQHPDL
jgi:ribonuclease HI